MKIIVFLILIFKEGLEMTLLRVFGWRIGLVIRGLWNSFKLLDLPFPSFANIQSCYLGWIWSHWPRCRGNHWRRLSRSLFGWIFGIGTMWSFKTSYFPRSNVFERVVITSFDWFFNRNNQVSIDWFTNMNSKVSIDSTSVVRKPMLNTYV